MVARDGGREKLRCLLNGYGVFFCGDESFETREKQGLNNSMNAFNATESYTLKWLIKYVMWFHFNEKIIVCIFMRTHFYIFSIIILALEKSKNCM